MTHDISSLRVFLKRLLDEGFSATAVPLADVIDVDTAEDVRIAERFMLRLREVDLIRRSLLGIFRETLHSPERVFDDYEILRLTGEVLRGRRSGG